MNKTKYLNRLLNITSIAVSFTSVVLSTTMVSGSGAIVSTEPNYGVDFYSFGDTVIESEEDESYNLDQLKLSSGEVFRINLEEKLPPEHYEQIDIMTSEVVEIVEETKERRQVAKPTRGTGFKINKTNVLEPSYASPEDLEITLSGTGLEGLGIAFVEAEENDGVNAIFLASLAALESQWGRSSISQKKNNIFGYRAYDKSPGKSAASYSSKEESIKEASKRIKNSYLTETGKFHKGYSIESINYYYSSDPSWHQKIYSISKRFSKNVENREGK